MVHLRDVQEFQGTNHSWSGLVELVRNLVVAVVLSSFAAGVGFETSNMNCVATPDLANKEPQGIALLSYY